MATSQKYSIVLTAQDLASGKIHEVAQSINQLNDELDDSQKETQNMTASFLKANLVLEAIKKGFELAGKAVQFMIDTGKKAVNTFIDLAKEGGKLQDVSVGFERNFKNSEKALDDLRKASNNTISDFDLMLSANKAALLGVSTNSEELAKLLEVARARGQQMGVDTTQAFEDIVTGIGRNSPLILDNLGIVTTAYKEQLAALEETGVEVDDTTKKQLLLSSVLESDVGPAVDTASTSIEQLTTFWANLKAEIAEKVAPVFQLIADNILPKLQEAWELLKESMFNWWEENKGWIIRKFGELGETLEGVWEKIVSLIDPTGEQADAFGDMASSITYDMIEGLEDIAESIGEIIQYLIDHPEAVSDFAEDVAEFATIVGDAVEWVSDFSEDLEKFIDDLNHIKRIMMDISTFGLWRAFPQLRERFDAGQFGGLKSGPTIVGEQGPEIVSLPQGSRVHSNEQSKMAKTESASSSVNINVNVPLFAGSESEKRRIAEDIWRAIVDIAASRNKTPNEMLQFT